MGHLMPTRDSVFFVPWLFRLLGARIGSRTIIRLATDDKGVEYGDVDQRDIGDNCVVDFQYQLHTFEDRLHWVQMAHIGDNVWAGRGTCVMGGCAIGANSQLRPGSIIWKTEHLPGNRVFEGSPVECVGQSISLSTGSEVSAERS